jgi:hypothetical protein
MTAAADLQGDGSGYAAAKGGVVYYYAPGYGGRSTTIYTASAFVQFLNEPAPAVDHYFRAQPILDSLSEFIASEGQSRPPKKEEIFDKSIVIVKTFDLGELPSSAGKTTLEDLKSLLPGGKR